MDSAVTAPRDFSKSRLDAFSRPQSDAKVIEGAADPTAEVSALLVLVCFGLDVRRLAGVRSNRPTTPLQHTQGRRLDLCL